MGLGGITSNGLDARDFSTQAHEDNNKKPYITNSPELISSSTNHHPTLEKQNPNVNDNSDTNKDSNLGVDSAHINDKSTFGNHQSTNTSSHLVLPDTTTNILADNNINIPKQPSKEFQNWNNLYNFPTKNVGQFTN